MLNALYKLLKKKVQPNMAETSKIGLLCFDLTDPEAQETYNRAISADRLYADLWDLDQELRCIYKYGSNTLFGEKFMAGEAGEDICELVSLIRQRINDLPGFE